MEKTPQNCAACGVEYPDGELRSVLLSGFSKKIKICGRCIEMTSEESFKTAKDIIEDIVVIATSGIDIEDRINEIKKLLDG